MTDSTPGIEVEKVRTLLKDVLLVENLLSQVFTRAFQQGGSQPLNKVVPQKVRKLLLGAIESGQSLLSDLRARFPSQQQIRLHKGDNAPADTTWIGLLLGSGMFVHSSLVEDMSVEDFIRASQSRIGCSGVRQAIANMARFAEGECHDAMRN